MKRMKKRWDFVDLIATASIIWIVVWLLAVGGWIANIVKLVGMDFGGAITIEFILRAVGVVAAPLGAIMGYL